MEILPGGEKTRGSGEFLKGLRGIIRNSYLEALSKCKKLENNPINPAHSIPSIRIPKFQVVVVVVIVRVAGKDFGGAAWAAALGAAHSQGATRPDATIQQRIGQQAARRVNNA